jgi:hypothetical protein
MRPTRCRYDWKNDSPNPGDCESNFGAVNATFRAPPTTPPFQPKPAYMAAETMQVRWRED